MKKFLPLHSNRPLTRSTVSIRSVHLRDTWRSAICREARRRRVMRQLLCERAQESWIMRWIRGKKNNINSVQFLTQTDRFVSLDLDVSSRAAGFNLVLSVYVFLSLKAVSPIDCHYMTDRLQRIEFKIFVCILLKRQNHLHPACPGGKPINITFSVLGELSL